MRWPEQPRNEKCRSQYHFATCYKDYLIPEQHELTQNGEGLQILAESPQEIPDQGPVQIGVKEDSQQEGHCNEVV